MFTTIMMDDNKQLYKTTTPTIYQHENNADSILVLLPEYYGNLSLRECSVTLNWLQPSSENSGNVKQLVFDDELYKDKYLQAIVPITVTETMVAGQIEIFLQIVNASKNLDMRTGSTYLEIKSHKNISDYIPSEAIDLFTDYLIKMQQLVNTCNLTLQQAKEQADRATNTANLMVQMLEEWEREHKS